MAAAQGWIDRHCLPSTPRRVTLADAAGLALAAPILSPCDLPDRDRALRDGYAVASVDTLGAGSYNPVPLPSVRPVSAGEALPPGADAVLPFEFVQALGVLVEALDAVAPGAGVERRGAALKAGTPVLETGRRLRPSDLGLLAALGLAGIAVTPRPRVRILLAGGPRAGAEGLGALLTALVRRDGGVPELVGPLPADRDALCGALLRPGADLVLGAGRTGLGHDDLMPPALARAGELSIHGIAVRPGDSAGLGLAGGIPVVLLPGEPMACLAAYELLGGRAVRRMTGCPAALPLRALPAVTSRKLVSEIGCVDLHRVRLMADGRVEPVASPSLPGLAAAARADGFVLIPAESEGVPEGAPVTIYLFDPPA
ncbi:molybdopterin-binding protein [Azospirillum agricola]|uniref:molybdopterin-binding protein n=1 Tax=Azospirillum agricola TaxID=1720247 RepID=UPI001B3BCE11|nr:molybdopterin-binding protein [Azospirillum agricola]